MWFIFPQIKGLGSSPMANKFAIASRAETAAYLQHPVLGPRLRECSRLVTAVPDRSIAQILGYPDDLKFRSSMTLFAAVAADNKDFTDALDKFYGGKARSGDAGAAVGPHRHGSGVKRPNGLNRAFPPPRSIEWPRAK